MSTVTPAPLSLLEDRIGYKFNNKEYLHLAVIHKSYGSEEKTDCNERLEFLGDSVLSFVTSKYLYEKYPERPEGELSPIRAKAVCEGTLQKLARQISLGDHLYLGHGEELQGGRTKDVILADAFEALLAAIFLDGGIEPVRKFLLPIIAGEIEQIVDNGTAIDDKSALQQFIQQEKGAILEYAVVAERGPAHMKEFEVEARLNGNVIGRGTGMSKRAAEQNAAREALKLFDKK